MLIRAIGGEQIVFTRFKIGNGDAPEIESALTDLVNPILSFGINEIDTSNADYVGISGGFDSSQIESDFLWKELGIFASAGDTESFDGDGETDEFTVSNMPSALSLVVVDDTVVTDYEYDSETGTLTFDTAPESGEGNIVVTYPTGDDVLYAYCNDGDNAGLIKANASNVSSEEKGSVIIVVGDAENVTAILSKSTLYAKKEDFDAHVADHENPHNVTREQIGLGNVPNVSTNDQMPTYTESTTLQELTSGEKMSVAFGKLKKAVKSHQSLINHISNTSNPHSVTRDQLDAAKKVHTHNASDISGGSLSVMRGGTGKTNIIEASQSFANQALKSLVPDFACTNLDTLIDCGFYTFRPGQVMIHYPYTINTGFSVLVFSSYLAEGGSTGNYTAEYKRIQIAVPSSEDAYDAGATKLKIRFSGDIRGQVVMWTPWYEL